MFWSVLKAVDISLGWQQILSLIGVASLSTLIPSAPGFVETYQYAFAFTEKLFGYESAWGVAAATAIQIFLLGSVTVLVIGLYLFLNFAKGSVKTSKE
jgi:glycosyltransferase 2 family protein